MPKRFATRQAAVLSRLVEEGIVERSRPPERDEPQPPPQPPAASDDAVRTRAYFLWVAAGRPAGDGVRFWLAAVRELRGG